ncbi:YceI family protein [Echinicola sp. 20G]|uniref:YceI family protein n=1 Tax=Echinicola sp. 20G TaxID=2781961 RepID=UPI001910221C|nr:YceI family protein [Echinicola sp. 20G]
MNSLKHALLSMLLVLIAFYAKAQESFTLSANQEFKVSGTSTLHDWDMVSEKGATGTMSAKLNGTAIEEIKSLKITLPVSELKSGKSAMDKKAYEAMDTKKNPNIYFELDKVNEITGDKIKATGKLTISGNSKSVSMDVGYKVSGGTVTFEGEAPITFTTFNVDPPTAMFNTIKTGNELKIAFNAQFKSAN